MIDLLFDPNAWAALLALSVLEIVLGIDNVIFISVMVSRLPAAQSKRARQIGLALAFVFRIVLLFTLTWMMKLTAPWFTVFDMGISGRDVILIGGGLFLIAKATHEIHAEIEARDDPESGEDGAPGRAFTWVVMQLALVDLVFSLDSIITAIGMAQDIEIMVAAVVIAMIVMYAASGPVSRFVADHPTTKMLALAFLVLIGVALVADGFDVHIPRGYIYFAMAFAAGVEVINVISGRKRRKRQTLRSRGRQ
jgi:predicted tellurium resistance membrane protein TerC